MTAAYFHNFLSELGSWIVQAHLLAAGVNCVGMVLAAYVLGRMLRK